MKTSICFNWIWSSRNILNIISLWIKQFQINLPFYIFKINKNVTRACTNWQRTAWLQFARQMDSKYWKTLQPIYCRVAYYGGARDPCRYFSQYYKISQNRTYFQSLWCHIWEGNLIHLGNCSSGRLDLLVGQINWLGSIRPAYLLGFCFSGNTFLIVFDNVWHQNVKKLINMTLNLIPIVVLDQ